MDETESVRERLRKVAHMGQEPKDRLWAIVVVLAITQLLLGGFLLETRLFLAEGRELSYARTATDCLELIIDNDRDFDFPGNCHSSRVVVHYPPEVCETYFNDDANCGTRWGE